MVMFLSILIKEKKTPSVACIIWMHGLGSNAEDMLSLADQLRIDANIKHVFMNAPVKSVTLNNGMLMPAWYDIVGLNLGDRQDKQGIEQSELLIRNVISEQIQAGFNWKQLFLAGFSQGAAMAYHTALKTDNALGGVIALSGYISLADQLHPVLPKTTPFFMGSGQFDPLVLPKWAVLSREWLLKNNYTNLTEHQYPMEHSVCMQEIKDISLWLNLHIPGSL